MPHPLLVDSPGKKMFLLGNEAIVRGAIEAGIGFITCYPGTPSSEAPDTFYRLSPEAEYYFEYSINEKVALEVGGGATLANVPTLVTMKHVGVNVAADPLLTLTYVGSPGGLVLLSADDPGCHSSQNEQDNRYYARMAGLPCFEPSSAQEMKDMVRDALNLSQEYEQPVMLRTTTRVNHLRGVVEFGPMEKTVSKGEYTKDPKRFVPVPANARVRHEILLKAMDTIQDSLQKSPWNMLSGDGEVGCIVTGISRAYIKDVLEEDGLKEEVKLLELGITWPLPDETILSFLRSVKKVLILEELDPLLESHVRELVQKNHLDVEITGKGPLLPRNGEYTTHTVRTALQQCMEGPETTPQTCRPPEGLPIRPPNLCAGCPHRATYYAVKKVFGDSAIYSSDIGCYTLGILPPMQTADLLFCMGSSISAGSGVAKASDTPTVAFIGDSTFYHSGITGLVNAVHNQHNLLVVVLDNRTTAMTGHQPHPGVSETVLGPNPCLVDLETVVKGCGVSEVRKVKPLNVKGTVKALEELSALPGVKVLIAEEPCPLFARRTLRKKQVQVAYIADSCENRRECLDKLACPAFYVEQDEVAIDPNLCSGCMVCLQICTHIKAKNKG